MQYLHLVCEYYRLVDLVACLRQANLPGAFEGEEFIRSFERKANQGNNNHVRQFT